MHKNRAMRTTLDIDDRLLAQAKSLAAREQTSLTRVWILRG
jgi:Arc/MetJ family transcription regulator